MQRKTQKDIVLERLNTVGYVDNFWAIQNYILRLGAIIHSIRADGIALDGAFGKELGYPRAMWKNYYYRRKAPATLFETNPAVRSGGGGY